MNREKIIGVQFGVFSPDEIKRRSVVQIKENLTYTGNEPVPEGLFDPRMGVLENNKICKTCLQTNEKCPGHFGHYILARPVFYEQFRDYIPKILKCVCINCSKLLEDKDSPEIQSILKKKNRSTRFKELIAHFDRIKVVTCGKRTIDGCGSPQPQKISVDTVFKYYAEWKNNEITDEGVNDEGLDERPAQGSGILRRYLSVEMILNIFRHISDEDCNVMGFGRSCRPDWMICTILAVPPPAMRPSVKQDNNQRSEDDITHKLVDIIKYDKLLRDTMSKTDVDPKAVENYTDILQFHVATLVNNNIRGALQAAHRTGRPIKSVRQRLGTKDGRIRNNLMGKRVDFSARTVITPDPNISIAEVGVPIKVAMNLTKPVVVTPWNIHLMYKLIQNGPTKYPGAKSYIRKKTGEEFSLAFGNNEQRVLDYGDIVRRHILDGDIVLFNRQPSLHKMSMMAHRARVMEYSTFRMNVSDCKPYNADFDGDEMNLHLPQALEPTVELEKIPAIPQMIVSPRTNGPLITLVQDSLVGLFRMSMPHIRMTRRQLYNILMGNKLFNGITPDALEKGYWSGRQAIGTTFPRITLEAPNQNYNSDKGDKPSGENFVRIVNGKYMQGTIDSMINKASKGLIHIINNDFGPEHAVKFIDSMQSVINTFLIYNGFSVGMSDLIAGDAIQKEISQTINKKKEEALKLINDIHMNIFDNPTGKPNQEIFERKINGILNKARDDAGNVGIDSLDTFNRMINMVRAGSKGSNLNVAQMIALVGQQNVDGKRISDGFVGRTLPHFKKYDDGLDARGFVENSFVKGLTPQEFFFHAMGGREGLIDTAVKTAETGYLQHKLVKAMEDLHTTFDYSVRNAGGVVIQYLYGDDGMDPIKIEEQSLPLPGKTIADLYDYALFSKEEKWAEFLTADTIGEMRKRKDFSKVLDEHVEKIIADRDFMVENITKGKTGSSVRYPIHMMRLIIQAKVNFDIMDYQLSDLNPVYLITKLEELGEELLVGGHKKSNVLLQMLMRYHLTPKVIIKKHRINKIAFEWMIETIRKRWYESFINPGEMVGCVAAQSIGEPATQLTLNTFHSSGISEKSNVTRGVPRLKNLISATKNPQDPILRIFIKPEWRSDKDKVLKVKSQLELITLKDLVSSVKIFFDPNESSTIIEEDRQLLRVYKEFSDVVRSIDQMAVDDKPSPWILRLELRKELMLEKGLTMEDIHHAIETSIPKEIDCVYSDTNAQSLVFRIRIMHSTDDSTADQMDNIRLLQDFERTTMGRINIMGLPGIRNILIPSSPNEEYVEKVGVDYQKISQYILEADGLNMVDVMNNPFVNFEYVYCNDVQTTYRTLGIEAARTVLSQEIYDVLGSEYINYRHLALLCDTMTYKGYLMPADRHGINKNDIGPLAKASFEETEEMLLNAAIFGELDPVAGVAANVMVGQPFNGGTSYSQVLLDEEELRELSKTAPVRPASVREEKTLRDLGSEIQIPEYCKNETLLRDMHVGNVQAHMNYEDDDDDIIVISK